MIRMYLKEGLAHRSHFWNSVACTQSEVSSYPWKDHCCIDTGTSAGVDILQRKRPMLK